jgi:hypothetical protein
LEENYLQEMWKKSGEKGIKATILTIMPRKLVLSLDVELQRK